VIEQRAILSVFGQEACSSGRLRVSSTKGATGHLLGAAGSVEAIFTALALYHGELPPNVNLFKPQGPLSDFKECLVRTGDAKGSGPIVAALCNSFGFGGTNASLLLSSSPRFYHGLLK
jgi:3-oxoacyl-[acyl-carrier-protein] synthase II